MIGDDAWALRYEIYRSLVATGVAPTRVELDAMTGDPAATAASLAELHDRHAIVLDREGSIRMALPFSNVPSAHRVVAGDRTWWANCAWDALAIPVVLGADATIEADWLDTGQPVELAVSGAELTSSDGWVHFAAPAAKWWDDIVET